MEQQTESLQRSPEARRHTSTLKAQIGRSSGGACEEGRRGFNFEMIQHFGCFSRCFYKNVPAREAVIFLGILGI